MHVARLHDGRDVIVKVRRPGIKGQVEQDMKIMAFLVRAVLVAIPRWRRIDPLGLIDETLRNLRREMDFRHEARNIRRFAAFFSDSMTIFVPSAMDGMQSEWVGVQQMSRGLRIDDPHVKDYVHLPLREWSFAEAVLRITRMSTVQSARMPRNLLVLTRTLFLMESSVRTLDPDFDLMTGLLGKGHAAVEEAIAGNGRGSGITRLKFETAATMRQLPEQLGALLRKLRDGRVGIPVDHRGLDALQGSVERASSRMALSMVALGLYIAASLLMQHSIGPQLLGFPVLAAPRRLELCYSTHRPVGRSVVP